MTAVEIAALTPVVLAALAVTHLVAFGLGGRVRGRRRYNAGVAYGRAYEQRVHGWTPDPFLTPTQRRRFLPSSDHQADPLVTRPGEPDRFRSAAYYKP